MSKRLDQIFQALGVIFPSAWAIISKHMEFLCNFTLFSLPT